MPLALGSHKWARLLFAAAAIYVVLLPIWWFSLEGFAMAAAALADLIYGFFDPAVSIQPNGNTVGVVVTASQESGFGGQVHSSALRLDTITYGLPMLVALTLSTRAGSITAKLRALGVGVLIMALMTVPAVMMWAALASLQLEDKIAAATRSGAVERSSFFYYAFHGYAFSQPVLAIVIWLGLMMLGLFKKNTRTDAPVVAVARNASCPCGSGRKYKRCCGALKG